MSMKIRADRVRKYKISEIKMLHKDDLPDEYLARFPHCYKTTSDKGIVVRYVYHDALNTENVNIDDEITEHKFKLIEIIVRASGKRLHKINHKNDMKKTDKKENEAIGWTGSYTFEA